MFVSASLLASCSGWPHTCFVVTMDFKHDRSLKYHWNIMLKLHNWLSTWIFVCVCPDGEWFLNKVWWDLGALKCCCHSYFTNSTSGTQGLV